MGGARGHLIGTAPTERPAVPVRAAAAGRGMIGVAIMKTYRPIAPGEWPRQDLRTISGLIEASPVLQCGSRPRVVAIACAGDAREERIYETFLELVPGVVASATWDLPEEQRHEGIADLEDPTCGNEAGVAAAAVDVASHYLSLGTEHLSGRLHQIRVKVRSALAALPTPGGGPRLLGVRLTGGEWMQGGEFRVVLRLECLDEHLFTDVQEIQFADVFLIDDAMRGWGRDMAQSYALRHALACEGATGTIDLLTLNAIAMLGKVRPALCALGHGMTPWASNDMHIVGERGHLSSGGEDRATGLGWTRNSVRHPTVLPEALVMACKGRPVTDLITHPMLSAAMTIVEAKPHPTTGHLELELEQPRWLFCHHSGRAWPRGAP